MWQLHPHGASLCLELLSAKAQPESPQQGLTQIRYDQQEVDAELLQVRLPDDRDQPTPREVYIRGRDLFAAYADLDAGRVCCEVYWRSVFLPAWQAAGLDVIVSLSTDLLESHPGIMVTSRFGQATGSEILEVPLGEDLWQPVAPPAAPAASPALCSVAWNGGVSYAEMVHPRGDGRLIDSAADPLGGTQWQLFGGPLEKGVIRRSCLRGVFLPSQRAAAAIPAIYRDLALGPLPLQT